MLELREEGGCYPEMVMGVSVGLACVDGLIAFLAFYQGLDLGFSEKYWQSDQNSFKKFAAWVDPSKGYFLYFVLTPVAACKGWICWSYSCGFIVMAFPKILFVAAFLLLLSFWVDLCHQPSDDEEDEGCSTHEALLEKINKTSSNSNGQRRCCTFKLHRIGSRQKIVILVYVDFISVIALLLGGALACYGLSLFLKMRKVRADRASWERWKVAGLAIVCVVSFTSSASIAIGTNIPLLYSWREKQIDGVYSSLLLFFYYFIGSSVPSAFILLVMRELPARVSINRPQESETTITFISDGSSSAHYHPPRWTDIASVQNQVAILFCIKSKSHMKSIGRNVDT
ncbi:tobamovirus multiplication 1 [Striga asiatica]|uniref:Tobamovirus multiplication 1 n=1 Tax=Striga asiatica TaxID=4170 RepID=A0A5A7NWE1_STRAF|nr:tobamovirus multiplication 1 [Striga asiatica]